MFLTICSLCGWYCTRKDKIMADIFRKKSLDKLSSPEQLDRMIVINSPMTWLALAGGAFIIAAALVWGIFGRVPITEEGNGILLQEGEVNSVYAGTQGVITKVNVSSGDVVKAGDVLYEVSSRETALLVQGIRERIEKVEAVSYDSVNDVATSDNQTLISLKNQKLEMSLNREAYETQLKELNENYNRKQSELFSLEQKLDQAEAAYYQEMSSENGAEVQYGFESASAEYQAAEAALQAAEQENQAAHDMEESSRISWEDAKDEYETVKKEAASRKAAMQEAEKAYREAEKKLEEAQKAQAGNETANEAESKAVNEAADEAVNEAAGEAADEAASGAADEAASGAADEAADKAASGAADEAASGAADEAADKAASGAADEAASGTADELAILAQEWEAAKAVYEAAKAAYEAAKQELAAREVNMRKAERAYNAARERAGTYEEAKNQAEAEKSAKEPVYQEKKVEYENYLNDTGQKSAETTKQANAYNLALSNYNTAKAELKSLETEIASVETQMAVETDSTRVQEDSLRQQFDSTKEAILDELNRELNNYQVIREGMQIKATVDGVVYSTFVTNGSTVTVDMEVARVSESKKDGKLQAVYFMQLEKGKKVEEGMQVNIYPSTLSKEEYGHMSGKVVKVADYVTSHADLYTRVGDSSLADTFSAGGAVVEIVCEIDTDENTASGYAWSSKKGAEAELREGTLLEGSVVTKNVPPITMLIPKLKEKFHLE